MQEQFWHERWENNQIGFHQTLVNPFLEQYLSALALNKNAHIFVPLCGKTLDIHWLIQQGFRVSGVELSEIAIQQLFAELNLPHQVIHTKQFKHYHAENLDIYVGNIFDLTDALLPQVDAVYDRAALVALPPNMRKMYVQHLLSITHQAAQLLIHFQYPQQDLEGPPFSISDEEIKDLYSILPHKKLLKAQQLYHDSLNQRIHNNSEIWEKVWLIHA
ncbi:thiopurine S-methyltransferase [Acinetobacter sp. CFCC 10889]|uniref:thiopurine S-methyltransferase n=1 Tax=Acinetobacter sp. CFCC 10889 TaxID=1775557 RepID=UPI000DD0A9D1|nr:thiopurine S-methyltransferase [Acinetobacter sp. CFCC 10889]